MTSLIMIYLIVMSIAIPGIYGINKNSKAETLGIYSSLVPIFWVIIEIIKDSILDLSLAFNPLSGALTKTGITGGEGYIPVGNGLLDTYTLLYFKGDLVSFDGLTLIFLLLTVIISPIGILSAGQRSEMISCLLAVEALLIGAFVTKDFLTFYVLFESVLIPMFFLIGKKGSGSPHGKAGAAYRFFLYTLAGSVGMLIGLIIIYIEKGTLNWDLLVFWCLYKKDHLPEALNIADAHYRLKETFLYSSLPIILIFVAFAVKVPMVPMHLWLPEAHTIAPTPGSMILAALLLKLGGYGMLRWLIPIFPEKIFYFSPLIMVLAVISTVYACLTCLRQIDVKRVIAYSSIVHMNICIFSIFTFSPLAIKGAIFEMFSHGIISAGLFFLIGVLYNRHDTRILKYFRGLAGTMPLFSIVFFIFILANSAVPLTCGFIGELLMLCGSISHIPLLTIILTVCTVLNAGYNIWAFNRICFGSLTPYITSFSDLTRKETYTLVFLTFYVFFLGLFPFYLTVFIDSTLG